MLSTFLVYITGTLSTLLFATDEEKVEPQHSLHRLFVSSVPEQNLKAEGVQCFFIRFHHRRGCNDPCPLAGPSHLLRGGATKRKMGQGLGQAIVSQSWRKQVPHDSRQELHRTASLVCNKVYKELFFSQYCSGLVEKLSPLVNKLLSQDKRRKTVSVIFQTTRLSYQSLPAISEFNCYIRV